MSFITFLSENGVAVMTVAGPAIVGLVGIVAHLIIIRKADFERRKLELEIANLKAQSELQRTKLDLEVKNLESQSTLQVRKLELEVERLRREKAESELSKEKLSLEVKRLRREANAAESRILPVAAEDIERHGVPFAIRLNRQQGFKLLNFGKDALHLDGLDIDSLSAEHLSLFLFALPDTAEGTAG